MVQMWLSPRDLCALAATTAARARLQRTLAACMGLSSAAPEVLFAMAAFHKFYQRTYERCVNDAGSRVDLHQLVEAPELVHRILEALGFCTFLDDDGVERPLRDERGRPVCAFLSDLRHAAATAGIAHAPMTYLLQFTNLPERLQNVKSQLQQLRPKKSSLLLGNLRFYDLNYNLELWHQLNNVLLHHLVRAEHWINKRQETSLTDRKYFLKWAQKILAAARTSAKAVLTHLEKLPEHRQARIAARNRESTRDQEAQQWRTNFKNFINQSWIPLLDTMDQRAQEQLDAIKPSIELRNFKEDTMDQQAEEQLESLNPSIELRSLGSRSEEPAPQVAGRPFPAPRSDSTAAPGPGPGPKPVPSKNLAAEDLCFQTHGHYKQSCDTDVACHFEPAAKPGGQGSCRLKSASPSSPGGPFVGAFIGDTPHKTKPPVSSSIEELARQAAAPPSNTRKERSEAEKEARHISETERDAEAVQTAAKAQKKAEKRERARIAKIKRIQIQQEAAKIAAAKQEQHRKATKAAKIAKTQTQTCGQLEEQEACIARQGCIWRPDKNDCIAAQQGKKPKQFKRRDECAALDKKDCIGRCVWDNSSGKCIPTTLITEDLRRQPFSPLRTSESPARPEAEPKAAASAESPARPEAEPKAAASAAKTSPRALRGLTFPSMWTMINSLPGAGSGGAEASIREASMRAHGQPVPPAATALPGAGSGGAEASMREGSGDAGVSMPPLTYAASDALHGSMRSSLLNPARQRREQIRQRRPTKQQPEKATLLASHVGPAVALLAALATGKLRR